jgi:hypothetical protein
MKLLKLTAFHAYTLPNGNLHGPFIERVANLIMTSGRYNNGKLAGVHVKEYLYKKNFVRTDYGEEGDAAYHDYLHYVGNSVFRVQIRDNHMDEIIEYCDRSVKYHQYPFREYFKAIERAKIESKK